MRFQSQHRSNAFFTDALTETNRTMAQVQKRSTPQAKAKMMADLTFFLQYLIVLLAIVIVFMLWHDYMSSWEDYSENSRARERNYADWADDYEDWVQRHEERADETTPLVRRHEQGPLSPDEVLRLSSLLNDETDKLLRSVKENPLSPEEVARLTKLIRADADDRSDYGSIVSRKRKAVKDSDDSGDEWLENPRTRKLKIETDAGVNAKWVCGDLTRSPSVLGERDSYSGYSADCEVPFTFRAPHPGRTIKSPVKQRK
ncbi:MAG: hypothetical protein L6R38_006721 [Xanthoria sp. 2 TBL-2021]|nr:MAG: hypothetical protein L6R38_006721 [Xanthoria sp. 2 TBL-2021]